MRISDWSSDVCSSDLFARRDHIVDLACQGFLEIEPPAFDQLDHARAQEIIVPSAIGLVAIRKAGLVAPYFDRDDDPLRIADPEIVKSDIERQFEILQQYAPGLWFQDGGHEAGQGRSEFAHLDPAGATHKT